MLSWLLQQFLPFAEQVDQATAGDSRTLLTARTAAAAVTSFLMALLLGPLAIKWLKSRFRERIDSASATLNELHAAKKNTPTMGGLFISAAILIAVLLWGNLSSSFVQIALVTVVGFTAIGAYDDWIKLKTSKRGLSVRQKLVAQSVLSAGLAAWLFTAMKDIDGGLDLVWPFGNAALAMGIAFIPWTAFVLVGSSNGVNLTDGLDGLASGCMIFAGSAMTALTYLAGHSVMADYLSIPFVPGAGEMAIVVGAMVGAMLGFLWFNCYPAQIFMGDAGSLPMGALLGLAALVTRQELLLVLIGGIFVIETLSVLAQVGWFKLTGRRLIACSPLHNHFLFKGDHEIKIVTRFWIGSALLAISAIASLKIL